MKLLLQYRKQPITFHLYSHYLALSYIQYRCPASNSFGFGKILLLERGNDLNPVKTFAVPMNPDFLENTVR